MKNILLIAFCLLVSTVWAKEEKNKRIQYCTTLEEAMQQAAQKHKPIFFNCYAGWAAPSAVHSETFRQFTYRYAQNPRGT